MSFAKLDGVTDYDLFFFDGTTGKNTEITQRTGIDSPNTENEAVIYQNGANVFWAGGGKVYVTNGITGERREITGLAQADFDRTSYVGSNAIWQKETDLFIYNSLTGETSKLAGDTHYTDFESFAKNTSDAYVAWRNSALDLFLYDSVSKTTTRLGDKEYGLVSINGSKVTLQRGNDFFYTNV